MRDEDKSKAQLIAELETLRQRLASGQSSAAEAAPPATVAANRLAGAEALRDTMAALNSTLDLDTVLDRLAAEQRQREIAETLGEVAVVVNSSLELGEVLDRVLLELEQVLPYDSASVMLLDDDILRPVAGRGFEDWEAVMALALPLEEIPAAHKVIRQRQPMLIPDTRQDPLFDPEISGSAAVRCVIAIPLIAQEEVTGLLSVDSWTPHRYSEQDAGIAFRFAQQVAVAIENARLYQALRSSEDELRRLNDQLEDHSRNLEKKVAKRTREIEQRRQVAEGLRDMVTILNSNRPLDEILEYVLTEASRLLGTTCGAIFRLRPEPALFTAQAVRGIPPDYQARLTFPLERSFLGQAVLARRPMVITDIPRAAFRDDIDLDEQWRVFLAEHYQTLLAVPLIRQSTGGEADEVYGGVMLYYPNPRHFSEEEIGLAVAFADQAALAIQNARLRNQVEQVAVMEERARLARELHDSVTQSLYSLTLFAEAGQRLAGSGDFERVIQYLGRLGETAQQALKEMRLLVYELRPLALDRSGLAGALQQRLDAVEERSGVEARLLVQELVELPPAIEEGLYRIAQEALNNTLKHAAATSVTVQITADRQQLVLEVTDDGQGFEPGAVAGRGGIGLVSMRERAEKLGARLAIDSAPGQGTTVRVNLFKKTP